MLAVGRPAGLPVLVAAVAVLGVAFAGMQLLPFAMVPDVIRAGGAAPRGHLHRGVDGDRGHRRARSARTSYSLCLAAGGFVASTGGANRRPVRAALAAVRYGFGLLPAALMLGGAAAATPLHPGPHARATG